MPSCVSLYGVRVSSSGLIYAVIVGAWAAYLVPMWLRRQDELNEARPTERFSTAIRLLSGRAGMERRYARELQERVGEGGPGTADPDVMVDSPSSIDVRSFAVSPACPEPPAVPKPAPRQERPAQPERPARRAQPTGAAAERARRMKALARRRRTTVLLFGAFTLGSVVAAVGGLAFLWAPAAPALLLSTYIVYLRAQERRRFAFTMDRRRAEQAAQRLRENRPLRQSATESDDEPDERHPEPEPVPAVSAQEAGRRALVEQTDHAEWVDQQRERGRVQGNSWEPVPVPLPTYVTAPVAPRASGSVDLGAPDTWSSARSSTAAEPTPEETSVPAPRQQSAASRRARTPLFDQYEDEDRPRAANE